MAASKDASVCGAGGLVVSFFGVALLTVTETDLVALFQSAVSADVIVTVAEPTATGVRLPSASTRTTLALEEA